MNTNSLVCTVKLPKKMRHIVELAGKEKADITHEDDMVEQLAVEGA